MSAGLGQPVDSDALTELIDFGEHGDNAGEFGDFKFLPRSDLPFRLPLPLFKPAFCGVGGLFSLERGSSFRSFSESDPISVSSFLLAVSSLLAVLFEVFTLEDLLLDFFPFPEPEHSLSCCACIS